MCLDSSCHYQLDTLKNQLSGIPLAHKARKRFGQNFLHDAGIIQKIISTIAPQPDEHLVEIGPGKGAITEQLLKSAGKLDAIELDRDLLEPLQKQCAPLGDLRLHNADALRFDFCQLVDSRPLRIIGNLPYNISTPLLFHLLDQANCIRDMHFMLQKEVVDRMAASAGSKVYGRLSIMLQVRCEVTPLFTIKPGAFQPSPKVDSAFVRLRPYAESRYLIENQEEFSRLVTQAFSQRRKTLRNCLRLLSTDEDFAKVGLDPGLRPEQVPPEKFVELSNFLNRSQ